MKFYTVHKPPVPSQDRLDQADELIFVREGFSWMAFFVPIIWLLYNRLWVETVIYIAIIWFLVSAAASVGITEDAISIGTIIISLFFGFEGNNLVRWRLDRQDYQMVGTVSGINKDECELKFFTYWLPRKNDLAASEMLIPGTPTGTAKLSGLHVPNINPKSI